MLNGEAALAGAIRKISEFRRAIERGKTLGPLLLELQKVKERFADNNEKMKTFFLSIKIKTLTGVFYLLTILQEKILPHLNTALEFASEALVQISNTIRSAITMISELMIKVGTWIMTNMPLGGAVLGGLGGAGIAAGGFAIKEALKLLEEFVAKIAADINDIKNEEDDKFRNPNDEITRHLEHMTGGTWRLSTQVPLQAATGRQINPREWAAREAAKKQRRNP